MSFLGSVFGGATNQYTPQGTAMNIQNAQTANSNYGTANAGLNSLAGMLTQQAQGQGPNLANQQLQNATAQNVANQAALAANQRGAGANAGLLARQAAQTGAQQQQTAAGQSAANTMAQQLAAQQQLAGVYGTQGQLANSNYGIAQGGINSNNQIGANIAGQNTQANQQLLSGVGGVATGLLHLADGGKVSNPFSSYGSGSSSSSPFSSAFSFDFLNNQAPGTTKPGQQAPNMQQQQVMPNTNGTVGVSQRSGAGSGIRNAGGAAPMSNVIAPPSQNLVGQQIQDPTMNMATGGMALPFGPAMQMSSGGKVDAMVSPGELIIPPNAVNKVAGGMVKASQVAQKVPGKPKVKGDSEKNDTVPAKLPEGAFVVKRSKADSDAKAQEFVSKVKAHEGDKSSSDFRAALDRSISARKKKSV